MAIQNNQVVAIKYELKDAKNGDILDSNMQDEKSLKFIMGQGHIIPGLENEIAKLNENDETDIFVKASQAYGEYDENATQTLPKEQFAGIELVKGMTLFGQGEDGNQVQVIVKDFTDDEVTVDFNHPLAGKDLTFTIKIVEVRDATEQELQSGMVKGECCGCGCDSDEDEHECCGGHGHHHGDHECCGGGHHNENECCGGHHHSDHECCGKHKH